MVRLNQQEKSNNAEAIYERGIPSEDGFHMPGEFEPHHGCIMIWPYRPGSWPYGAKAAKRVFAQVAAVISQSEKLYMLAAPKLVEEACDYLSEAYNKMMYADKTIGTDKMPQTGEALQTDKMPQTGEILQSDKVPYIEEICQDVSGCSRQSICAAGGQAVIEILAIDSNDAWARDVAPTFVTNNAGELRGISWRFNAWGGDYDGLYADWEKDDALAAMFCSTLGIPCYDAAPFVLEGGAIHSDGEGTILATEACLLSPGRNPSLSKEEIEHQLKKYLGAEKILWLPHGIYGDETNEHVDNICAFVRPGEVVLAWTDDVSDPQYAYSRACLEQLESRKDAKGRTIKVHKLYIPAKPVCIRQEDLPGYVYEEGEAERTEGERLAASYVNFYISNGSVLVPQFHDVMDEPAVALLTELFPERKVVPVYARDILLGGGNIHCITQQIPYWLDSECTCKA